MKYLEVVCRCVVGLTFAVSAGSKVAGPRAFGEFVGMLRTTRLIGNGVLRPAAVMIVLAEMAVAVALAIGAPIGYLIAGLLLTIFIGAIAVLVRRETAVRCRCFGPARARLGYLDLARNGVLWVIAGAGLLAWLLDGHAPVASAGQVLAAVTGVIVAGLLIYLNDLVEVFVT
ncbi:MauE/DoxX family redox-associated membrane protein [Virgisporangium aurantiacum]|uniref:Methylamine utilization protein MauE n=1 Tax=Virgisporangium aurantiacum TaxID=175570 RepID=A0A8J3YXZ5_9ACTN|nr:MauE/DoxX family redox-associated membrane protein [Virgisporangium aurantiacum]GIJ54064.1 methylamine utilization protein MauE [Virgisporangium aurantiacum]